MLLPLVMTIFFDVSGGPYGLESVVSQSGSGIALLLILVTPLIWSLPAALMTAELTSAIPAEGGYYVWVKQALGPFPAFLCGWWSWVYAWVDISLYPILFVTYLAAFCKQVPALAPLVPQSPLGMYLTGIAVIVPFTILNVRGTKITGQSNVLMALLLLAPFALLVLLGLWHLTTHPIAPWQPVLAPGKTAGSAMGAGLLVVMWNYMAWDSLSMVTAEVDEPRKKFPRALFWALPLITLTYFLPTLAGLTAVHDPSAWTDGAWPAIAASVGGRGWDWWLELSR